jgi:ribosomal protein S18 acetylase RimI-like enzyme
MIDVVAASEFDAAGIAHVYVDAWRHAYAGILPEKALLGMTYARSTREWSWIIRNRTDVQPVIVARGANGIVLGMASVGLSRAIDRPQIGYFADSQFDAPIGEVQTLYVHPDWQDRGIGRGLLAAGFEALARRDCVGAFLWVLRDNPSRFFYERVGGERIAERGQKLWGAPVPQLAYGWKELAATAQRLAACSAR